ncbi:PAQR family membrane homeostasis protein TrhA [Bdellovibrio sp. HCB185ZH]|uniref:PAQR family membrane homeostasis protein TrhA n=1 Tax=Bdellovibrio sp. HCB185ZH TaxID=3394235 RepID=UPI0039A5B7AB
MAAFFAGFGATAVMMAESSSVREFVALLVYSLCFLNLFAVSAVYHLVNWAPQYRVWMKRFDHCSIYLMIAGTGTPLCMVAMPPESGMKLLMLTWSMAVFGVFQSLIWVKCPRWISSILYLVAGWIVVPFWADIKDALNLNALVCLVLGGVFYSVGAIAYALKKPKLWPLYFGYHEIFHAFVIAGAFFHFVFVFLIMSEA